MTTDATINPANNTTTTIITATTTTTTLTTTSTEVASTSSTTPDSNDGLEVWQIAVIASGLGLAIIAVIVVVICARRKRPRPAKTLPRLDGHGLTVRESPSPQLLPAPSGDQADPNAKPPLPHSTSGSASDLESTYVYADPNQTNSIVVTNSGSGTCRYANVPPAESTGTYVVPLDHRPPSPPLTSPITPESTGEYIVPLDHRPPTSTSAPVFPPAPVFPRAVQRDDSSQRPRKALMPPGKSLTAPPPGGQEEVLGTFDSEYMPMDLCMGSPGKVAGNGSMECEYTAADGSPTTALSPAAPPPCGPAPTDHCYVNTPRPTALSEGVGRQQSEEHYQNVSLSAKDRAAAATSGGGGGGGRHTPPPASNGYGGAVSAKSSPKTATKPKGSSPLTHGINLSELKAKALTPTVSAKPSSSHPLANPPSSSPSPSSSSSSLAGKSSTKPHSALKPSSKTRSNTPANRRPDDVAASATAPLPSPKPSPRLPHQGRNLSATPPPTLPKPSPVPTHKATGKLGAHAQQNSDSEDDDVNRDAGDYQNAPRTKKISS